MNVRGWVWALLAIGVFCGSAQAGSPPTKPADVRNVSGLETGDAGQSIKPLPSNTGAATGTVFQISGNGSVWTDGFTIGATSVILGLLFVFVVHRQPPSVSKLDSRR